MEKKYSSMKCLLKLNNDIQKNEMKNSATTVKAKYKQ